MDTTVIDQEYQKLQDATGSVEQKIKNLAGKLQQTKNIENDNAREWTLDLKEIALAVQSEQNQMFSFLQTLHDTLPQMQDENNRREVNMPQQNFAYRQQGNYQQQPQQKRGFFSSLLGSNFGRAIEMGAGFGIGDDLINSIF